MRRTWLLTVLLLLIPSSSLLSEDSKLREVGLNGIDLYFSPQSNSRDQVKLQWLIERYDFQQLESYIENYYGAYYKYYEKYLTVRQKEFANKFGLTDIFVQPSFRRYENTHLIFKRNFWKNRIIIRYKAPLRDITDFDVSIAFRPSNMFNIMVRTERGGNNSFAAAINKPIGETKKKNLFGNNDLLMKLNRIMKK